VSADTPPAARAPLWVAAMLAMPAVALVAAVLVTAVVVIGAAARVTAPAFATNDPSATAVADIPADYLALYRAAGQRYGLDWAVLAAIGKVETDHGRSTAPGVHAGQNSHGCCAGPMQFFNNRAMAGGRTTWDAYGVDGDHDGRTDIYNPADAIMAAGNYLKALGAASDARQALFGYNHAWWYVDQV
jgi:Transglycosylase SLT domain